MFDRRGDAVPRRAVAVVFLVLGATAGTWAARIPAVKDHLHLSAGTLGLCLLGPAVGSMVAMPAAGAVLATLAPRRVVQFGLLLVIGLLPLTVVASSPWQLFAVLTGWGVGAGLVDVGMNTEAAAVEARLGRRTMSSFHAAYSLGGLIGAGLGGVVAAAGVSAGRHFLIAAPVLLLVGLAGAGAFASQAVVARVAAAAHDGVRSRWPQWSWTLMALAAMAFACFLVEGAANDWGAVYLHSSLGASAGLAAIAYAAFALTMTAGRLAGDRLAERVGPVRLVRVSTGAAAVTFAVALVVGRIWSGLVAFAILGAGVSFVVPLVFTAASRLGRPGPNLATVASCGYFGMLVGPAIVGGLAQAVGLPAALGTVAVLSAVTALLAGAVGTRPGVATAVAGSEAVLVE
ncbi:MAG TPA: MFS transporter [Acidimicrobiales bacterium]|nr:MFS transporter [Acidimicrobiales bacterium]